MDLQHRIDWAIDRLRDTQLRMAHIQEDAVRVLQRMEERLMSMEALLMSLERDHSKISTPQKLLRMLSDFDFYTWMKFIAAGTILLYVAHGGDMEKAIALILRIFGPVGTG